MFTNFEIMAAQRESKIYFFFEKKLSLSNRARLKSFLEGLFKKEGRKLDYLNYIFCSDERLRMINRNYLNHDYYTDIITFELADRNKPVLGEIYISVDRVKENSKIYRTSITRELHRVMFHGVLHLFGHDDKRTSDRTKMKMCEEELLKAYFKVPRDTVSR